MIGLEAGQSAFGDVYLEFRLVDVAIERSGEEVGLSEEQRLRFVKGFWLSCPKKL